MLEARYTSGEHLKKVPGWHVEESPWKAKQITRMLREKQHYGPMYVTDLWKLNHDLMHFTRILLFRYEKESSGAQTGAHTVRNSRSPSSSLNI
jgi:hypothetical protein